MSGEWGELESEGDVYAAKVIGQKPTVLGVKKKLRGRQLQSDSLREAYSAGLSLRLSYPPIHVWPFQILLFNGPCS